MIRWYMSLGFERHNMLHVTLESVALNYFWTRFYLEIAIIEETRAWQKPLIIIVVKLWPKKDVWNANMVSPLATVDSIPNLFTFKFCLETISRLCRAHMINWQFHSLSREEEQLWLPKKSLPSMGELFSKTHTKI